MIDEEEKKPEPDAEDVQQQIENEAAEPDPALEELRPFWERRVEAHPRAW